MADAKVITFLSSESCADALTAAHELADEFSKAGQAAIILSEESSRGLDPRAWVERAQHLSPGLLRNYVADPRRAYASISFSHWPALETFRMMLGFMGQAYDWIFIVCLDDSSAETTAILDASDLLLWIHRSQTDGSERWERFLQRLTGLHLPTSFARDILFDGDGLKRRDTVSGLARQLLEKTFPFRAHEKMTSGTRAASHVVEHIKNQVQPQLLQALGPAAEKITGKRTGLETALTQKTIETCLAAEMTVGGSRQERSHIVTRVLEDVLGLGPLEPLLKDPDISEILVNGHGSVYVEKKGRLYASDTSFTSEEQLRTIIDRIVAPLGRRVDESSPLCDARLADGSRVNIVLPPLALDGAVVTIRKFSEKKLDLAALVGFGSMSEDMADFLRNSVIHRQNIIVSGGTGSGKTTLLNDLSSGIPEDERIVTIEDAAELKLQKPHVVRLESRPANAEGQGCIPIRSLVMNALRMRPDRIVVGECRGGEALDMLQAMNTGHDGSLTTLHANSPRDAMGRLETLVLMAGVDLPVRVVREQIRSAVNLIVQQARRPDGSRKVISIAEVTGMEGETLLLQELYRFNGEIFSATGLQSAAAHWGKPS